MNERVMLFKWLLCWPHFTFTALISMGNLLILVTAMLALTEVDALQRVYLPRLEVIGVLLPITISLTSATKNETITNHKRFLFDSINNINNNNNKIYKHISFASNQHSQRHHEHHWGPFFEDTRNISNSGAVSTVHLFTKAILNCRVGMLRDKVVMWVRRTADKVSLLTVGNITHSSDPRLKVKFQYPNNWQLVINPIYWKDAGIYMCQVSTHPPRIFTTNLTVIEAPVRLVDDHDREVGDRYFRAGSTIDLQCQISLKFLYKEQRNIFKMPSSLNTSKQFLHTNDDRRSVQFQIQSDRITENLIENLPNTNTNTQLKNRLSKFVFWAKDDKLLSRDVLKRVSFSENWFTSRISITDAKFSDGGNYSCSLSDVFTAIVQVHVLKGELPAAVQDNSSRMLFFQSSQTWTVMRYDYKRWYCWSLIWIIPAFLPSSLIY